MGNRTALVAASGEEAARHVTPCHFRPGTADERAAMESFGETSRERIGESRMEQGSPAIVAGNSGTASPLRNVKEENLTFTRCCSHVESRHEHRPHLPRDQLLGDRRRRRPPRLPCLPGAELLGLQQDRSRGSRCRHHLPADFAGHGSLSDVRVENHSVVFSIGSCSRMGVGKVGNRRPCRGGLALGGIPSLAALRGGAAAGRKTSCCPKSDSSSRALSMR